MDTLSWVIIAGGVLASFFIIGFGIFSLYIGEKSIFPGSGIPASMAQMLLSSVHITSQHLLGALIIVILSLLMAHQVLTTEAGLPLLSAVIGYLLGKNFKDVSFTSENKSQKSP
jgi:hypothetical protein